MRLSKADQLKRAKKHFFSLGLDDGSASLCQANFQYGLAKIHYAQLELGMEPNATFISTPDETISRNVTRWKSGYGYGGKLTWSDGLDKIIFVDTKPNACGMLVGGLETLPNPVEIIQKANNIMSKDYYIDNIKLTWDFKKGNHFIDLFECDKMNPHLYKYPPFMFIMHGSVPELRKETERGVGIYYDQSKTLMEMCRTIETPFGKIYYLDGDDAKNYWELFYYAKQFAAKKRSLLAKLLFGKFKLISNPMHQGLQDYGTLLLGAQSFSKETQKLFPVALRSDLPAYLVQGEPSLTPEMIEDLGFENRAKKFEVLHRLLNFNALPHGGGYKIPHITRVVDVQTIDNQRYFICEQENEEGKTILSDMQETQFVYRGKSVITKIEKLNLGLIKMKLFPKYILKI